MSPKTISQLHAELLRKKNDLLSLHETTRTHDMINGAEECDVEESWFNKERLSIHWKQELAQIERSLMRMQTGRFGLCDSCDEEIPVKRLKVRPDAHLCLNCQEMAEHQLGPNAKMRNSGIGLLQ